MFDLRLMGVMKKVPIAVVADFMPWAVAGFAINLTTGLIFVISEPAQYFSNPTWWVKVAFLVAAGVNAIIYQLGFRVARRAAAAGYGYADVVQDHRRALAGVLVRRVVGRAHAAVHRRGNRRRLADPSTPLRSSRAKSRDDLRLANPTFGVSVSREVILNIRRRS